MTSPFPGMDPYLEHPARWTGWHTTFITLLMVELNEALPDRYVATVNERLYLIEPNRDIYPDVDVRDRSPHRPAAPANGQGAVGTMTADPSVLLTMEPREMHEPFVEIVPVADQGRVVTTIELLSPTNKAAGSAGRREYRVKQREILAGPAHLLEIDLLRRGEHTVAAPYDLLTERYVFDYVVSLSRGDRREVCQAWPFTVRQRLPRVAVPLAAGDADLSLALQQIFDRAYEAGAYARRLDYRDDAAHALKPADAAWADALLREKGLRPAANGDTA